MFYFLQYKYNDYFFNIKIFSNFFLKYNEFQFPALRYRHRHYLPHIILYF